ncbi:MAG TPA: hypothetical protein VGB04_08420 [Allosphingosinicella sp.]|jgi:hypothetical protein
MADIVPEHSEQLIQRDLDGLAALLKAVETAMDDGSAHLTLGMGGGMIVSSGAAQRFVGVTVTFPPDSGPSDDFGWTGRPDPAPQARERVLETPG